MPHTNPHTKWNSHTNLHTFSSPLDFCVVSCSAALLRYENQDFGFDEWNSRNPLLLISSTDSGSDSVNSGAKSAQFLSFIRRMPTAWKLALPRPFGTARELACGRAAEVRSPMGATAVGLWRLLLHIGTVVQQFIATDSRF